MFLRFRLVLGQKFTIHKGKSKGSNWRLSDGFGSGRIGSECSCQQQQERTFKLF